MNASDRHRPRASAPTSRREVRGSQNTSLRTHAAIDAASQPLRSTQAREWTNTWRREVRPRAIRLIAARAESLRWSPALLNLVLEELGVDDLFVELLGTARTIPRHRYAQAVAVAIALRHSWRLDNLASVSDRLGLGLGRFALSRGREFQSARISRLTTTARRRSSAAAKGKRS
jgi:hypothetical protein